MTFGLGGSDEIWDARTPQERADLAIDWKRLRSEVLEPLKKSKKATWQPFNWEKGAGLDIKTLTAGPKRLIILEGAYSTRPELQDLIDFSILVEVLDDTNRRNRLISREGNEYMEKWHKRWDPAEEYYFSSVRPKNCFDFVIHNKTSQM